MCVGWRALGSARGSETYLLSSLVSGTGGCEDREGGGELWESQGDGWEMDEKLEFIMLGAHGPCLSFFASGHYAPYLTGFRYFSDGALSTCCLCDCP